jgi:hypothetical protein
MKIETRLDRYGVATATAARREAEDGLRDAATALLTAVDDYERALGLSDPDSAQPSLRGAEMHVDFAQRRVQRAALRARDVIMHERLAGSHSHS